MSTWHQRQPARRARENGTPYPDYRHPTKWQVMVDPPNDMMYGNGTFDTRAQADAEAAKRPYSFVLPPKNL